MRYFGVIIMYCVFFLFFPLLCRSQSATSPSSADSLRNAQYKNAVGLFYEHDDSGEALEQAKLEFIKIVNANPRHAPALAYLGMISLESNNIAQADSFFQLSLAVDPTCPEAHVGKAQAYRAKHQWSAGLEEARLGVRLAPDNNLALWELCSELLFAAETPVTDARAIEAMPLLTRLIKLNHDDREAHLEIAKLYERFQKLSDAVIHYREVLRIGQTNDDMDVWVYTVHLDVERCLEAIGRYGEAADELEKYLTTIKEYGADKEEVRKIEEQIKELREKGK